MISVHHGRQWRERMVRLVSTHAAFQHDGATNFKYDPQNPTLCVWTMLYNEKFLERQFALKPAEGVPINDPICCRDFGYMCWK
jgi:hypothetical protein